MPEFIFGQQAATSQPGDLITSAATTRANCLLCDGSEYSRTTYSGLYGAIGTSYGSGNGSTTFNVPDFRGKAVVGANTSGSPNNVGVIAKDQNGVNLTTRNRGAQSGEETHSLTLAQIAAHNHGVNDPGHNHGVNDSGHSHTFGFDPGSGRVYALVAAINPTGWGVAYFKDGGGPGSFHIPYFPDGITFDPGLSGTEDSGTGISIQNHSASITTQNNGSGNGHQNMQPFGVANVFIHT